MHSTEGTYLQSWQSNQGSDSQKMSRTHRENGFVKITLAAHNSICVYSNTHIDSRTHTHSTPNTALNIMACSLKVKPVMTVFYGVKLAAQSTFKSRNNKIYSPSCMGSLKGSALGVFNDTPSTAVWLYSPSAQRSLTSASLTRITCASSIDGILYITPNYVYELTTVFTCTAAT